MRLEFDIHAIDDLRYWTKVNKKKAEKILHLIGVIYKYPFSGEGKPEPLKFNLAGCWSRRLDKEHRIVYSVNKEKIRILTCRYHY